MTQSTCFCKQLAVKEPLVIELNVTAEVKVNEMISILTEQELCGAYQRVTQLQFHLHNIITTNIFLK